MTAFVMSAGNNKYRWPKLHEKWYAINAPAMTRNLGGVQCAATPRPLRRQAYSFRLEFNLLRLHCFQIMPLQCSIFKLPLCHYSLPQVHALFSTVSRAILLASEKTIVFYMFSS